MTSKCFLQGSFVVCSSNFHRCWLVQCSVSIFIAFACENTFSFEGAISDTKCKIWQLLKCSFPLWSLHCLFAKDNSCENVKEANRTEPPPPPNTWPGHSVLLGNCLLAFPSPTHTLPILSFRPYRPLFFAFWFPLWGLKPTAIFLLFVTLGPLADLPYLLCVFLSSPLQTSSGVSLGGYIKVVPNIQAKKKTNLSSASARASFVQVYGKIWAVPGKALLSLPCLRRHPPRLLALTWAAPPLSDSACRHMADP